MSTPTNQLFQGNKFPGSPFSAFVLIYDDNTGLYQLSFNPDFDQLYPSDPDTIVAGTPIAQSPQAGEIILASVDAVNLNTATPQALYTCPTGVVCAATRFGIRNVSISLSTVSFSIGWNSASFNNVLANATHTELTGATLYTMLPAKDGSTLGVAAGILKLLNNTLQGAAATCTVDVFGYHIGV